MVLARTAVPRNTQVPTLEDGIWERGGMYDIELLNYIDAHWYISQLGPLAKGWATQEVHCTLNIVYYAVTCDTMAMECNHTG